jgi:hypothetical protein
VGEFDNVQTLPELHGQPNSIDLPEFTKTEDGSRRRGPSPSSALGGTMRNSAESWPPTSTSLSPFRWPDIAGVGSGAEDLDLIRTIRPTPTLAQSGVGTVCP